MGSFHFRCHLLIWSKHSNVEIVHVIQNEKLKLFYCNCSGHINVANCSVPHDGHSGELVEQWLHSIPIECVNSVQFIWIYLCHRSIDWNLKLKLKFSSVWQSTDATCMMYMKDAMLMFIGGLIVALAVQFCNLHKRVALKVISIIGCSQRKWVSKSFRTWFVVIALTWLGLPPF